MTRSRITVWHCDAHLCRQSAPEDADGWADAIYTHGCPQHGDIITAHKASLTYQTSGRGSREVTTWYLRCACGWTPRPHWAKHSARLLHDAHLVHVNDQRALDLHAGEVPS